MRTVLMTFLILFCLSGPVFSQTVASVSGDRITLNIGRAQGVKVGMEAFILVTEEIDGELVEFDYARIRIVSVTRNSSTAKIVEVGTGYELRKGLKVRSKEKLAPPELKEIRRDKERPAPPTEPARREPDISPMTLMEKIKYAGKLVDQGKYRQAVRVYEVLEKEAPDDKPFRSDYERAHQELARQEESARQRASEKEELAKIQRNLDYYRTLVAGYEQDGEFSQALDYQHQICRVDQSAGAQTKLNELKEALEKRKLQTVLRELVIEIQAREYCWVNIVSQDGMDKDFILNPGELFRETLYSDSTMIIGNAGGITLTLNGNVARPLGSQGQVVELSLSPTRYHHLLGKQEDIQ